jgi:hypothetical protein
MFSDSDITRLASAIVDELERRKEERRVERAKERATRSCLWCDDGDAPDDDGWHRMAISETAARVVGCGKWAS